MRAARAEKSLVAATTLSPWGQYWLLWFVLGFGLTVGCLGNRWRYGDMCPRLNRWTLRIGLGLLAVAVVWIVVGFIFTGTEVWPSH